MNDFNINEVDFYSLDIAKYLDWLLDKYKTYSTIWLLPFCDEQIADLQIRNYEMFSHYLKTRSQKLPEQIENLYKEKIKHFENQKRKYDYLKYEVISFDSVRNNRKLGEVKKYGFFDADELSEIKITDYYLRYWLIDEKLSYFNDLIDELNERKKSTPLKDVIFYQKELNRILQDYEFNYLPQIIEGDFIYNLDNDKNALSFATEIDKIRLVIYLNEKIQGDTVKHSLTKPIKWTGNVNALATVFYALADANIIETSTENIKRLLISNFTDSDNKELSKHYLDEIFKVSKGKLNKEVLNEIQPLLSILTKNSPQA